MGFYQVKSSALVKRYVHEIGSGFIQSLLDPVSGNTISLSHISFIVNADLLSHALPPLVFVCADAKLCLAAIAEGLVTDNPNLHP